MLSQNMGSYRKDIWDYMLRIYGTPECDTLEYRDFLHAIRRLIQEGKLLNEQGLFRVETNTYREIWDVKPEAMVQKSPTSCTKTGLRSQQQSSVMHNPLIPAAQRLKLPLFASIFCQAAKRQQERSNELGKLSKSVYNPFIKSVKKAGKARENLAQSILISGENIMITEAASSCISQASHSQYRLEKFFSSRQQELLKM